MKRRNIVWTGAVLLGIAVSASAATKKAPSVKPAQRAGVHATVKAERQSLASAAKAVRAQIKADAPDITPNQRKARSAQVTADAKAAQLLITTEERSELQSITAGTFTSSSGLHVTVGPDGRISISN